MFTKGPWRAVKCFWPERGDYWAIFHDQGPQHSSRSKDHAVQLTEDNARLIAAAPDLYEACKLALAALVRVPGCDSELNDKLDEAIRKAEAQ